MLSKRPWKSVEGDDSMNTTAATATMVVDQPIVNEELTEIEKLKIRLAEQCGLDPESIMTSRLAQYDLLLSQGGDRGVS